MSNFSLSLSVGISVQSRDLQFHFLSEMFSMYFYGLSIDYYVLFCMRGSSSDISTIIIVHLPLSGQIAKFNVHAEAKWPSFPTKIKCPKEQIGASK